MPEMDGIEVTKIIKQKHPSIKILIVSTHSNIQMIAKLIRMGADGYLLKNAEKQELLHAINTIQKGETYFCKEVEEKNDDNNSKIKSETFYITELSSREKEILVLIAQEFTGNEIAEKTFISLNTVNTHRRNLISKLNVKNTAGLVKYAIEYGLLD
jgi:DNA-binding NarL/FixJ family response regulator